MSVDNEVISLNLDAIEKKELGKEFFLAFFKNYYKVFISGASVAGIITFFTYFPCIGSHSRVVLEHLVTEHVQNLPVFLFDAAVFIAALSIAIPGSSGRLVRKFVLVPMLEFLFHAFGIAAGVMVVIFASDPRTRAAASMTQQGYLLLALEGGAVFLGLLCDFGIFASENGISGFLNKKDVEKIGPRLRSVIEFAQLPIGVYFMSTAYQDIVRLSLTVHGAS